MKYSLSARFRGNVKKSDAKVTLGVLYGKGTKSTALELDASELIRTYRKAGSSSIVHLNLGDQEHDVIIKQIDLHPTRTEIQHVDLYAIKKGEKVSIKVPLVFEGEAPAVKNHGGIFLSNHDVIEVRCLPKDIPHELSVDISSIEELHGHVILSDLSLDSKKLEILHMGKNEVLCTVIGKQKEVAETPEGETEDSGADEGDEAEKSDKA